MNFRRGLWIWDTSNVLSKNIEQNLLSTECKKAAITDVYLYLTTNNYTKSANQLKTVVSKLKAAGVNTWGLDGGRTYFSDASGPADLYANVKALIAYNKAASANEKLVGFQCDNEVDDYSGNFKDTFHNDIKTSQLKKTSGSGVWKDTQVLDREYLMQDWLATHAKLKTMLSAEGLKIGAALPSWLDDYYGEPLNCTYNGITQTMMKHFVKILDDYAIMSYQTDVSRVIGRVKTEMAYASAANPACRVFAGVETHKGRGGNVTYGDNLKKNSRSVVLSDIKILETNLKGYSAFAGVNIHDWVGWKGLRP